MRMPLVSVVMPSYNHAKFVGFAIDSVLEQTYTNWELIITDDGSSDDSPLVINKYNDERIHKFFFSENKGAAVAVRNCLERVRGKYIALLNSDDSWNKDKLQKQVTFLESNPQFAAVFSNVQFVNERGNPLTRSTYQWADVFQVQNKSQGKWLEHFFFKGNCICHPSILARKEFYGDCSLHQETLRQLPDFNMWIKLSKKHPFYVLPDKLVNFRVLDNNRNTSADTLQNKVRNINELYIIYHTFFDNIENQVFIDGFGKYFKSQLALKNPDLLKYEKIFLYFQPHGELTVLCKLIGVKKLYDCLCNTEDELNLKMFYGFGFKDFHKITGELDPLLLLNNSNREIKKAAIKDFLPYPFKGILKAVLPNSIIDYLRKF